MALPYATLDQVEKIVKTSKGGGGGTEVEGNPEMGPEDTLELDSIKIKDKKYKVVSPTAMQEAINAAITGAINAKY